MLYFLEVLAENIFNAVVQYLDLQRCSCSHIGVCMPVLSCPALVSWWQ